MNETFSACADRSCRVDVYLAEETELTRSAVQRLIREGRARVNGGVAKANCLVAAGDTVTLDIPEPVFPDAKPENIPIDIVYEDTDICVVNKAQGMVVHPAPGHESGTLVNALLYHLKDLSGVGGALRPGIVHRIDRMTSGLLVIAKNDAAHLALSQQFKTHDAGRTYLALVDGNLREDSGRISASIGRHATDRKKMAIRQDGREAVTDWLVVERFGSHTLLRLKLHTGRTHQIRVHMASVQHPVTGDSVYGSARPQLGLAGQALHGYRLHIVHPATGKPMDFVAELPGYFTDALRKLGFDATGAARESLYEPFPE